MTAARAFKRQPMFTSQHHAASHPPSVTPLCELQNSNLKPHKADGLFNS